MQPPICKTLTSLYQNLSSTNPKTPNFPLNLFSTCKSEVIINELQLSPSRTKCLITIPHRTFKNLSKEILACNIERNIKPELNIFQDLGFSPTGITGIVAADSVDFIQQCCSISVLRNVLELNTDLYKVLKMFGGLVLEGLWLWDQFFLDCPAWVQ